MSRRDSAELIDAEYVEMGKGYESISRDALQDRRLSYKARGIMSYLKSKPPRWKTNTQAIADDSDKDGYEAVNSGIRELEELGYFARLKRQGARGRWEWLWIYSDDPRAVAARKAKWEESTGRVSPRRGPTKAEPVADVAGPDESETETAGHAVSGFPVHGSPGHGEPVDGPPVSGEPPNKKEIQRRDPEREGGDLVADLTSAPSPTAEAPPPKADWKKPETWLCGKHLVLVQADPGVDIPPCPQCGRVKDWGRRKQAEAAVVADQVARECSWHDAAGDVVDPVTGVPFQPVVRCDCVTTSPGRAAVISAERAALTEPDAGPIAPAGRAEYRRRFPLQPERAPAKRKAGSRSRPPVEPDTSGLDEGQHASVDHRVAV